MPTAIANLLVGLVTVGIVACGSNGHNPGANGAQVGGTNAVATLDTSSGGTSSASRSSTRNTTPTISASGGRLASEGTTTSTRATGGGPTATSGGAGVGATDAVGGSTLSSGGTSARAGNVKSSTGGRGSGATTPGGASNGGSAFGAGGATTPVTTISPGGSAQRCTAATSLKQAGQCAGRLVGAALSIKHLSEEQYARNAREFDYVTAEDEMKWDATEPTRNQFTFTKGDQILDFATSNGMKVKGHTLVWYNQLPSWVSSISSASDLRAVMLNHIQGVMQHYKGKVVAWDVVNEAWDDTDPAKLRDSVFSRVLGKSYIDDAFTAARAADPDAKLFYNDYATDGLGAKANSVYAMVKDLKARNIPIDGVGMQMHWRVEGSTLTAAEFASNMQRLVDLGVEVVISEMDVQLCKGGTLEEQQARFHDMVAACIAQPKCTAVTFWGITDKYSWLNARTDLGCTTGVTPRPLLWDDNYDKKPAYTGVMAALLGVSLE